MTQFKNDRILKALQLQPVDRTPIWIMRQAGRYLPEYCKLRANAANFMEFCKTPSFSCEATLQPLARFELDAAIIFSDILTVVDALGFDLEYIENKGPVVHNPVRTALDLRGLSLEQALDNLQYVFDAVSLTVNALDHRVPLIGFAGSPWTVACYMISSGNIAQFKKARQMVYENPVLLHQLLDLLTELTVGYLNRQVEAGARILMLFDSWGGLLSSLTYPEFSLRYMQRIAQGVHRTYQGAPVPLVFFTKQGGCWLELIAESACDAIGVDWTVDLGQARARIGGTKALQGNLDPLALYGSAASVQRAAQEILTQYGSASGLVFNLGHGIDKATPIENVSALVEAVQNYRFTK